MDDLAACAVAAHEAVAAAQARLDAAVAGRVAAVDALRAAGWSFGRIADLLGLSKTRVVQLVTPAPPQATRSGRGA